MFKLIYSYETRLRRLLLLAALATFCLSVGLYLVGLVWTASPVPEQLMPATLLGTVVPALSVLLIYELLLLTLAVQKPFVVFVRHEFEVISLIVLRDVFKKLDTLAVSDDNRLLIELAVTALGAVVLYFLVEVLERIEHRSLKGAIKRDLPDTVPWLQRLKNGFELALVVYFALLVAYEGIGLLAGLPGTGYDQTFLALVFSGLIVFNVMQLFMTLLATDTYEVLFEHSALVLASVVVLIALQKAAVIGVPMIVAALLFVVATLFLHGFARGQALGSIWRRLKKQAD